MNLFELFSKKLKKANLSTAKNNDLGQKVIFIFIINQIMVELMGVYGWTLQTIFA